MVSRRFRGFLFLALAGLVCAAFPSLGASACPFCMEQRGPTLIGDFKQASMVLFGKFTNPRLDKDGNFEGGSTDFMIEDKLKDDRDIVGKKKVITLPRYVPKSKSKFLIFCDEYKGKIDPYRGVEVLGGNDIVKYLKGAKEVQDKAIGDRLRYCFDYLDNPELEIALDAYREFAVADYKDYRDMAKKLPPDKIAGWLKDAKTPPFRYGLYASLLGHCGKDKHAQLLREMLDNKEKRSGSGVDGMLFAYVLLKPKEGWVYVRDQILAKPKEEFQLRYAGLRTIRNFWETRPDVVPKKDIIGGLYLLLDQSDVADFAIEDLRKWKVWEATDKVLQLAKKESHNVAVIRRAILRFALSAPKNPKVAAYIQAERKRDKEYVNDVEELLKLETETPSK
jgi:hypothetical protein